MTREYNLSEEQRQKLRERMLGEKNPNFGKNFSDEHREKIGAASRGKRGADSRCWKGGELTSLDGYVHIFKPEHPNSAKSGYILKHRLVMSIFLGRPLTSEEIVHHLNGIRTDNRIENLAVLPRKFHNPTMFLKPYIDRIIYLEGMFNN